MVFTDFVRSVFGEELEYKEVLHMKVFTGAAVILAGLCLGLWVRETLEEVKCNIKAPGSANPAPRSSSAPASNTTPPPSPLKTPPRPARDDNDPAPPAPPAPPGVNPLLWDSYGPHRPFGSVWPNVKEPKTDRVGGAALSHYTYPRTIPQASVWREKGEGIGEAAKSRQEDIETRPLASTPSARDKAESQAEKEAEVTNSRPDSGHRVHIPYISKASSKDAFSPPPQASSSVRASSSLVIAADQQNSAVSQAHAISQPSSQVPIVQQSPPGPAAPSSIFFELYTLCGASSKLRSAAEQFVSALYMGQDYRTTMRAVADIITPAWNFLLCNRPNGLNPEEHVRLGWAPVITALWGDLARHGYALSVAPDQGLRDFADGIHTFGTYLRLPLVQMNFAPPPVVQMPPQTQPNPPPQPLPSFAPQANIIIPQASSQPPQPPLQPALKPRRGVRLIPRAARNATRLAPLASAPQHRDDTQDEDRSKRTRGTTGPVSAPRTNPPIPTPQTAPGDFSEPGRKGKGRASDAEAAKQEGDLPSSSHPSAAPAPKPASAQATPVARKTPSATSAPTTTTVASTQPSAEPTIPQLLEARAGDFHRQIFQLRKDIDEHARVTNFQLCMQLYHGVNKFHGDLEGYVAEHADWKANDVKKFARAIKFLNEELVGCGRRWEKMKAVLPVWEVFLENFAGIGAYVDVDVEAKF